jgi:hypothetical protein
MMKLFAKKEILEEIFYRKLSKCFPRHYEYWMMIMDAMLASIRFAVSNGTKGTIE